VLASALCQQTADKNVEWASGIPDYCPLSVREQLMTRGMRLGFLILMIIIAVGLVGGCIFSSLFGGGKLPTRNYYIITYTPTPKIPVTSKRPYPYTLQIGRFVVQRIYNRQNITYRFSPNQIQYYDLQMWAVRPDNMISDIVLKDFQVSMLTNRVGFDFLDTKPDFRLDGNVEAIEKYDAVDLFYAHLAMTMKLINVKDGSQVWTYSFDERKRVYGKEMVHTVTALSSIVQSHMDAAITSLDSLFLSFDKTSPHVVVEKGSVSQPAPPDSSSSREKIDESGFEIIPEKKR
jgi:ABC-type uncharacterized transport system auxiliary subunit